eukprot:8773710-Pyramimonas_sp.AAC.1
MTPQNAQKRPQASSTLDPGTSISTRTSYARLAFRGRARCAISRHANFLALCQPPLRALASVRPRRRRRAGRPGGPGRGRLLRGRVLAHRVVAGVVDVVLPGEDEAGVAEDRLPTIGDVEDLLRGLRVDAEQLGVRVRIHAGDIPARGRIATRSVVGPVQAVNNPQQRGQRAPRSCERRRTGVTPELLLEGPDDAAGVVVDDELQVGEKSKNEGHEDEELRNGFGRIHRPHSRNLQARRHGGQ